MKHALSLCLAVTATVLAGCAASPAVLAPPPQSQACPAEVPVGARCYNGEDGHGAFYRIAIPSNWDKQVLVMHAHGGPADTGPAQSSRSEEDLKRWAVTVKAGYAWAGSSYRRGGYGVTMAAEDTERLRQIFVQHFGSARRTLLHGQSYGGGVASKAAEIYAAVAGRRGPYDGVLLTNSVLGGGQLAHTFRLDLRGVYQYVCKNHPKPDEVPYPLWQGLPMDSTLTRAELLNRIDDCTGVRKPAAQRSAQQAANLATIVNVLKIREQSLAGHMNFATWLFRDLTQLRLDKRNPFDNSTAVYSGSANDAALNAGVLRYKADPQAVAELAKDSAPDGRVNVPTLSIHAANDPTAFVELESAYREVRERAGSAQLLVQTFSDESDHSYLAEAQYPALFTALLDWVNKGDKPTPQAVLALCRGYEATYGKGCRIQPDYRSPPLSSRVTPR
ncbi:MAG: hypothetical protein H0W47_09440 [Polaromonas sp.]|uniref:hypothetical protein n=1 Tax=Polaromonas sp. TaxID=1869339 RepID=UPI0018508688|nr:hypothetical protein [Polaromonas sp.]MBA3594007.1 hypothetical protein [Polaromonas sp.]